MGVAMAETISTSNAHLEELAPSTASFRSSIEGWEKLDDRWIDSAITSALEAFAIVSFQREVVGQLYRYTLSLLSPVGMKPGIELGKITYRRIDNSRVSLWLKSSRDILKNKELKALLDNAAAFAKIRVDHLHNVGTYVAFNQEKAPWFQIDEPRQTQRLLHKYLEGSSFDYLAFEFQYSRQAAKNKIGRLRKKYNSKIVPYQKDLGKYTKWFVSHKPP